MALTVSPAIRIVSLLGLLLALAAGGAMHFMGGGSGSASAVVPSQNSAVLRAKHVAATASARAKHLKAATAAVTPAAKAAAPATHKAATAKPRATAAATTKTPAVKPAPKRPSHAATRVSSAVAAGLPLPLAQALAANPTVVVALYNPQSEVDGIAFAEARAGAALAGAGFVGLNVLSAAQVGKLTEQIGLLPDPAVLVFSRPTRLAARIDGFADKETVAQAAQNAARRP